MTQNARSFPSDHVEGGYNDRVISEATIFSSGCIADCLLDAAKLFSDSDPTNDKLAYTKLMEASDLLQQLTHVHWTALDGNRTQAKKLAKQMTGGK